MSEKGYGILGTIIIHNIILLILLFSVLTFPEHTQSEGSILINFGETEIAGGTLEPKLNNIPYRQPSSSSQEQTSETEEDGILTQSFEEAPVINQPDGSKKTNKQQTKKEEESKPVEVKKETEKEPVVNAKALYSNKGSSTTQAGTSQGIYKGAGNMGDPQGTPESDNYSAGLTGSSIGFNLSGRNPIYLQKPDFSVYTEGTIVVEITVDQNGKVIQAKPGVKGSTLVDNTLYAAVKKAALESKFNVKNDAPEKQIGTITYHFRLQ